MQPIKISQNDGIPESCLLENVNISCLPAKYQTYMTTSDNIVYARLICSTQTQTNTVIQSHQNDSNHNSTNYFCSNSTQFIQILLAAP